MTADESRMQPYVEALRNAVTPDSIVLDIGAGTGIMSILACRFGARKVYAVEPNPLIHLAKGFAAQYKFKDKIEFIENISTKIELAEKADVLICDLHGNTPFNDASLLSIIDARERLLKPDAVLIPQRDTVFLALVECEESYTNEISRFLRQYYDIDMTSAKHLLTNRVLSPPLNELNVVSEPQVFTVLEYATLNESSFSSTIKWKITKKGVIHGFLSWFECELGDGLKVTNSPDNSQTVYGVPFFPFDEAIEVEIGDYIEIDLNVNFENGNYTWNWNTAFYSKNNPLEKKNLFFQSTFAGIFIPPSVLLNRSEYYSPQPNETTEINLLFLNSINGEMLLGDIADTFLEKFPNKFKTFEDALAFAATLSKQYSV